jgi:hypothetical protein
MMRGGPHPEAEERDGDERGENHGHRGRIHLRAHTIAGGDQRKDHGPWCVDASTQELVGFLP